jgi:hypothetical protein
MAPTRWRAAKSHSPASASWSIDSSSRKGRGTTGTIPWIAVALTPGYSLKRPMRFDSKMPPSIPPVRTIRY